MHRSPGPATPLTTTARSWMTSCGSCADHLGRTIHEPSQAFRSSIGQSYRQAATKVECTREMPGRSDSSYNLPMAPSDDNSGHSAAGRCQLCGRLLGEERLTRHHLLPRSRSRKMKRRRKGRQELKRRDPGRTVALCGPCHRNVHVSIGNTDLARGYDSVEALSEHPGVRRFTEWVKDKPHGCA
jgi:hypothetical protein